VPCLMPIACQESLQYFQRSALVWWAQFLLCLFQDLSQLGDLPVAVHFIFKYFFVGFLWCYIYQLLLLLTCNFVVFFVVQGIYIGNSFPGCRVHVI